MKPQDIWNATYNQLELQLDRASFDTWLRSAVFLGIDDGVYCIGVHNSYAVDMLQHRLYRIVRRVLSDIAGHPTEIQFEVHKPQAVRPTPIQETSQDDAPLFRFMAQQNRTPDLPETSETKQSLFAKVQSAGRPELPDTELNPRFVFDRYVVNKSNQVVYEAALAVAEYPATIYNPFLIYGGVGLGKTHLLQSIAHVCQIKGLRTIYIPSEIFTNDLVTAIRNRSTAMFREKYRSADVLLVDDIQFIAGKDSTQEEFFHTFNALVNFNKQIILASDRHPRELKTLEDRLKSRFVGGLVADIQPPELETRLAILHMWRQEHNANLSDDVLYTVAERAPKSIRELEGAFNRVMAQSRFGGGTINLPTVTQTMEAYAAPRERISIDTIISITADKLDFSDKDLRGKRRTARVNKARQIAMYLTREMTEASLPQIGEAFGGRSHTTVLHGINKIEEELEFDRILENRILKIRKAIAETR